MNLKKYLPRALAFIKNHFLVILGTLGFIFGVTFSFTFGTPALPVPNQLSLPPSSPFTHNISGIGFVEANTENINIGSFTSGIVHKVCVKAGDIVKKGEPLFILDRRSAFADIALQEKKIAVSQAQILASKVDFAEKKEELRRGKSLQAGREISLSELEKREFAVSRTEAQLKARQEEHAQGKAELDLLKITLEKLTVQAPVAGTVFKVNIHPGEFVSDLSPSSQGLILMGHIRPLHMRVQIDENDGWRFNSSRKAYAYLRSHKEIHFPLSFVRLEPYAQPKQRLSGDSSERVDTRVFEIIYRLDGKAENIYVGQQFDVFIEAPQDP